MESDWAYSFAPDDDEFVQDYSNYFVEPEQYEHYDDSYDIDFDLTTVENEDDDASEPPVDDISEKRKKKTAKKETVKQSKRENKRKRKERNYQSPLQQFYATILQWPVNTLLRNQRNDLQLPPLVPLQSQYSSKEEFYFRLRQIPLEEVRHTLYTALRPLFTASNPEILVTSAVSDVFQLQVLDCESESNLTKLHCTVSVDTSTDIPPGSIILLLLPTPILATLIPNASFSFWVATGTFTEIPSAVSALLLANVITFQRMFTTTLTMPNPGFLRKMLLQKSSKHIKFDDADSSSSTKIDEPCNKRSDIKNKCLNASQYEALQICLSSASKSSSLELIQGPPGCGKTHFTAHLLSALITSGATVMMSAPSNKAVAVAIERFLSISTSTSVNCALFGVYDKIHSTTTTTEPLRSTLDAPAALNGLPSYVIKSTQPILHASSSTDIYIYTYDVLIMNALTACVSFSNELCRIEGGASFVLFESLLVLLKDVLQALKSKLRVSLYHKLFPKRLRNSYKLYMDKKSEENMQNVENMKHYIHEQLAYLRTDMQFAMDELPKHIHHLQRDLLSTANIIFCTLASSGAAIARAIPNVDIVVVDEAGQCLECELIIPFDYQPKHLFLIGDPCQLPATVTSPLLQAYATSTMQRLISHAYDYHMLTCQYRMHMDILHFPNRRFYSNKLDTDDSVIRRRPKSKFSYLFVHIEGVEEQSNSGSRCNTAEAKLVVKLCEKLRSISSNICIITFYSAQVLTIRKFSPNTATATIATVDSFQGSEADIVIISFVRSNNSGDVGFVKDYQRLNVALTRAKHCCVLVGNTNTLKASKSEDLRELIMDASIRGCIVDATEVEQHGIITQCSHKKKL